MTPPPATSGTLFTLGHSSLELGEFLSVLVLHKIPMICDVRSRPVSFRFPQFNREPLEAGLSVAKIHYQFLGETLGGRPGDPQVYRENGMVDYLARRKSPDFCAGVDHAIEMSRSQNIAIMCAEEDPLQCHRFLMICPELIKRGAGPVHIRRGGALESQLAAEDRLLKLHDLAAFTSDSLFVSERDSAIEDALRKQSEEYAFRSSPEAIDYF